MANQRIGEGNFWYIYITALLKFDGWTIATNDTQDISG